MSPRSLITLLTMTSTDSKERVADWTKLRVLKERIGSCSTGDIGKALGEVGGFVIGSTDISSEEIWQSLSETHVLSLSEY